MTRHLARAHASFAAVLAGGVWFASAAHATGAPTSTVSPLPAAFAPHAIAGGVIAGDDGNDAATYTIADGTLVDVVIAADVGAAAVHGNAIDGAGDVAGTLDDGDGTTHAFVWLAGSAVDAIVVLHGDEANGIDDAGDVVGAAGGVPVLWPAGALDPGALPFAETTGTALCISGDGATIAGDSDAHSVAWSIAVSTSLFVESTLDVDMPSVSPLGCGDRIIVGSVVESGVSAPFLFHEDFDGDTGAPIGYGPSALPRLDASAQATANAGGARAVTADGGVVAGFDVDGDGHRRAVVWLVDALGAVPHALDDGGENDAGLALIDGAFIEGVGFAVGDVAGAPALWRIELAPDQAPVTADDVVVRHLAAGANPLVAVDPEEGVLLNDVDPDGDALHVLEAGVALPTAAGATITFDTSGGFLYVPRDDGAPVEDAVTYHATDGTLASPATLTIVIANAAPVAATGAAHFHPVVTGAPASVEYDSSADGLSFLGLAHDDDGDVLTVVETNEIIATAHGSFVVRDDGTFTFAPEQGFVGTDALFVHVTDAIAPPVLAGVVVAVDDRGPVSPPLTIALVPGVFGAAANVLIGASDPEGDAVAAVLDQIDTPNGGVAVVDETGVVAYQGPGAADAFDVFLTDGWAETAVPVRVLPATIPPPPPGGGRIGFPPPPQNPGVCGAASPSLWPTCALFSLCLLTCRRRRRGRRAPRDRRSARPSP